MNIGMAIIRFIFWIILCSVGTAAIQLKQPLVGPIMEVATNVFGAICIGIGWTLLLKGWDKDKV